MYHENCVVLLYAKAPCNGKVNTRLIPDIGVDAATQLQDDLIHHRLSMLSKAALCDVRLMCSPGQQDEYFLQRKQQYDVALFDQQGEDLGVRMFNGVAAALQSYKYCIVIGTDSPALDSAMIAQVIDDLQSGSEVVLVPAEDGGYVLIAMSAAYSCLFEGVSWGSDRVMKQTVDILVANKITYKALGMCWDIDRLADYQRYLQLKDSLLA